MTSTARTSAGTVIAISTTSTAPTTYDETGLAALTYADIGEVTNLGEYGRIYNLVTHNPLADRRTVKRKGSFNDGSITLQMASDRADAGQTVIATALDSDESFYFRVTHQDGSIDYFSAQTMSYTKNVGTVDQIYQASTQLEIDNDIIEVAAP